MTPGSPGAGRPAATLLALGSRLLGIGVLLALAAAFTPLPNRLAAELRPAGHLRPADAIVVLGAGVNPDGIPTPASLLRLVRGLTLYREGLAPVVVVCGTPPETGARVELAERLGAPPSAVQPLSARTTREEARQAWRILGPSGHRRILLVTSGVHLRRAAALFERVGFAVDPVPADFVTDGDRKPEARLALLRLVGQEMLAQLYYRLAGYL